MIDSQRITNIEELQTISYEGLQLLKSICEKHNLQYMLAEGTLLGAVRHKGFIPWDDDIDTMMPRSDYEKLKKLNPSEFGDEWRLYSYDTVPGFYQSFMKLCYLKTEKRPSPFESGLRYGISVDIFPLDDLVANDMDEAQRKANKIRKIKNRCKKLLHPLKRERKCLAGKILGTLFHLQYTIVNAIFPVSTAYKMLDRKRIGNDDTSKYVVIYDSAYKQIWLREDVVAKGNTVMQLPFHGALFNVPMNYDKILQSNYGNYMELPPIEKRISGHVFDAYYVNKQ